MTEQERKTILQMQARILKLEEEIKDVMKQISMAEVKQIETAGMLKGA